MTALELTLSEIIAGIPSTGFCVWYVLKKHWLANNILGIAFSIEVAFLMLYMIFRTRISHSLFFLHNLLFAQGIELLSLGSFKIGAILLVNLI